MKQHPEKLALFGGTPVRKQILPYAKQCISEEDISAVSSVLTSDWLTTGPQVPKFERDFADFVQTNHAVAVSNGTAALHAAVYALGIESGDEVIVPAITFAATANSVVFQGGKPIFADVEPDTLLIDPERIEPLITPRTKAIFAVDYAGQPCNYRRLREIADQNNLFLVDDACHALGGKYHNKPVGSLADLNTFSFHPAKNLTTGEGGMITTDNTNFAKRMRLFRNHGISTDHHEREQQGSWFYEMVDLGYNYRLTDIQCALGISQLKKVQEWIQRRQEIAQEYSRAFRTLEGVIPLMVRPGNFHAYHLFVVRLAPSLLKVHDRAFIFKALRAEGIGVNVHYIPVHLHPYYRSAFGTKKGDCPVAEAAYECILSLPMFPLMSESDVNDVIHAFEKVLQVCS